jgi:hypothetical protein
VKTWFYRGVVDNWNIVSGHVDAKNKPAAKAKVRRRHKRVKDVKVELCYE